MVPGCPGPVHNEDLGCHSAPQRNDSHSGGWCSYISIKTHLLFHWNTFCWFLQFSSSKNSFTGGRSLQILMLRQMKRNSKLLYGRNVHLYFYTCSLCWIWFCCYSYFCISILLSRLQKKMSHLILLFSLFLAPAFADRGSQKSTQNLCSNDVTHKRQKRDWIWNQMHIKEEIDTPLPHHVGKVSGNQEQWLKIANEDLEKQNLFAV